MNDSIGSVCVKDECEGEYECACQECSKEKK
jgi:hypothetical protein